MVHLYDNFADTWGSASTGIDYQLGNPFKITQTGAVTQLGWYRVDVGAGVHPDGLALFRRSDGALLAHVATPADSGVIGWQWSDLADPVSVINGSEYVVCAHYPAGNVFSRHAGDSKPTPPANVSWLTSPRQDQQAISETTYPGAPDGTTGFYNAIDITLSDPLPSEGGAPTATGDLQAWLISDPDLNLHQTDGLPWLTKVVVDQIRLATGNTPGQLDATKAVADAIHDLLTATDHNLGTLWDLAGHLADLEIAAWQHFFGAGEQRLTGPDSAGGSAFYTADGQLISQLVAETWQRVRVLRNDLPFGVDPWTMTAEADFEDAIAFAEPADAYVVTITSYQPTQPATTSPAGLWLPRLGWWCVLTGSLASERRFVDFQQEMLSDQGRRMAGCAIQLKPGTIAHVQAWLLA
jgi:hypothetical protein